MNAQSMTSASGGVLTPVDTACELIWNGVPRIPGSETVDLLGARGRILAEDVRADMDVPPYANSAMDGYAVRTRDVGEVPVRAAGRAAHYRRPERRQIADGRSRPHIYRRRFAGWRRCGGHPGKLPRRDREPSQSCSR